MSKGKIIPIPHIHKSDFVTKLGVGILRDTNQRGEKAEPTITGKSGGKAK